MSVEAVKPQRCLAAWLSVAWQALGSAATLGTALWVSWRLGLAAQGEYGLAKSWFDAAAAIAGLGLPQGLLHLQYRLKVPAAALLGWLQSRGWLFAIASAVVSALLLSQGQLLAGAVVASLPFSVGHLLARSLIVAGHGVVVFGFFTALPALLTLVGTLVLTQFNLPARFDLLLWLTVAMAGIASMVSARQGAGVVVALPWSHAELWRVSLQSWLQAALGGMLAALLLSAVSWSGRGGAELGTVSLTMHLYQLFAVLAGYVAPILFDRLARQAHPELGRWPHQVRWWAAFGLLMASLLALAPAILGHSVIDPVWSSALPSISLMLLAGMAAVAARVEGTVLLARSDYLELSLQAGGRLVMALAVTLLTLPWMSAAAAVALALLSVELATWWRAALCVRRGQTAKDGT